MCALRAGVGRGSKEGAGWWHRDRVSSWAGVHGRLRRLDPRVPMSLQVLTNGNVKRASCIEAALWESGADGAMVAEALLKCAQ